MVRPLPGVRRVEHDRGITLRAVRQRCVIPAHCKDDIKLPKDMKLLPAKNVRDAVTAIFI